jgi:2-polyprenyl-3-methyl-5-hydroxy-6-metoxy-1,4-benzoquinol methylase
MGSTRLTQHSYWDEGYAKQDFVQPDFDDFRHLGERKLVEKIESLGLNGRRILEVGAGNSTILTHLARKYRNRASFSGLDYSDNGCRMLARRAELAGANIEVYCQDLFDAPDTLIGRFDVAYSLGLVEHFSAPAAVLTALKQLLAPRGQMLTVIPNMAGVIGTLVRRFNPSIYELHVPHRIQSLVRGHEDAGLLVESAGYICSTNFGILSSCFSSPSDKNWQTYMWLSRLTKLLWFVEDKAGDLPQSATLSPYMFVVSRRPE